MAFMRTSLFKLKAVQKRRKEKEQAVLSLRLASPLRSPNSLIYYKNENTNGTGLKVLL